MRLAASLSTQINGTATDSTVLCFLSFVILFIHSENILVPSVYMAHVKCEGRNVFEFIVYQEVENMFRNNYTINQLVVNI